MSFPIQIRLTSAAHQVAELTYKATESLSRLHEGQIQIGSTPKEVIYQEDNVILYRYTPVVEQPFRIPLLICYALVNRPYMVDLQEDRSLVRELLGICQGGTFSMCYTALHPEKVKDLVTMVAPADFNVCDGLLNVWSGCSYGPQSMDVDLMVNALGNIPGDFMNFGFLMLKPFQLNVEKYIGLADVLDDEAKLINFLRMEKWIFDSPDQAGETFRQFIQDFFQANKLIKGEIELGGRRVNLGNITMPVLNLYAEQDHLVPPASSIALEKYVGTKDYTVKGFPAGHIGMYVSGKVQRELPPTIAQWLTARG